MIESKLSEGTIATNVPMYKWTSRLGPSNHSADIVLYIGPTDCSPSCIHCVLLMGPGVPSTLCSKQKAGSFILGLGRFALSTHNAELVVLTFCRLLREMAIFLMSLLNLSSSCSRTTEVGETTSPSFLRITSSLNSSGSLAYILRGDLNAVAQCKW